MKLFGKKDKQEMKYLTPDATIREQTDEQLEKVSSIPQVGKKPFYEREDEDEMQIPPSQSYYGEQVEKKPFYDREDEEEQFPSYRDRKAVRVSKRYSHPQSAGKKSFYDRRLEQEEKKSFFPVFKEPPKTEPAPVIIYKRPIDMKLTILLIENTTEVFANKEVLAKIIKRIVSSGLVCVINYGSTVRQSEISSTSVLGNLKFLDEEDVGSNSCLYDALKKLESLVSEKYMCTGKEDGERFIIKSIDVIGIGTCKDSCSETSKEVGIDSFGKVISKSSVTTKYFCLTEDTFMNAAEIGFRSIGAIIRNY